MSSQVRVTEIPSQSYSNFKLSPGRYRSYPCPVVSTCPEIVQRGCFGVEGSDDGHMEQNAVCSGSVVFTAYDFESGFESWVGANII